MEKTTNEENWAAAYNPNEPIEDLYDRLEECFVVAIVAKPSCTMDQMVDKALIAVQRTGLYATAILEWNAVDIMNQTWPEFKMHFTEAYDLRINLRAGTEGTMGYHGVNNATGADGDSWSSINEGLMAQMQQVQLANNTSAQATNENISALSAETRKLREALLKTQQQLEMFTRQPIGTTPTAAPTWPHVLAKPPLTYIPPPPHP